MLVYLLTAGCAVAVVFIASRLIKRSRHATEDSAADGPTNGHAGSMLSALFLLAFAIAIVVPWTAADAARLNTYAESQAIVEAYWAAGRLPAPAGPRAQAELADYTRFVHDREWPRMRRQGRLDDEGWTRLDRLRREVIAVQAKDDDPKDARTAVLDHLSEISGARHQRAMDAKSTPPPALLFITVLTGLVVIALPFLSGARPRGMAMVPLVLMAALLGLGVWLCFDIAHVFSGALAVDPDAFGSTLAELRRIAAEG
ncbi:bestrophin-like domain [Actinomadura macrotermitis]|uniref:DUF4239 domain-containing protein n=1 Tax=Actinomadura macrotermitis TaxID=2585200 RepID=A0A7K0C6L3_9ACTN|nr:DUF4239 domain-containing protein [Actinomadura macrotermitis]MQY08722.1 hypothetical protein [Actinomadura macrotermitis]